MCVSCRQQPRRRRWTDGGQFSNQRASPYFSFCKRGASQFRVHDVAGVTLVSTSSFRTLLPESCIPLRSGNSHRQGKKGNRQTACVRGRYGALVTRPDRYILELQWRCAPHDNFRGGRLSIAAVFTSVALSSRGSSSTVFNECSGDP